MTERRARMRYDGRVNDAPMPVPNEVRLQGRTPRGQARANPGCAILFSIPFIAAGIFLTGAGMEQWPLKTPPHQPMWVIVAGGAIFALAGLLVLGGGIWQLRENARRADLLRSRPGEPWLADHPWSARSTSDDNLKQAAGSFFAAAFLGLFLVPFNWWAFISDQSNFFVIAVVGIFDAVNLLILGKGAYLLIRYLKYGTSTLVFRRFPFFLGETVEADFRTSADIRSIKKLVFTLRCVREQIDTESTGTGLNLAVFEIWKDERIVESPSRETPMSFRLPAEAHYSTEMPIVTPRYWELEVTGETPGVDFGAKFLVPVYARPAG